MTSGIYSYIDKKTNDIIYIGKDSYIHRNQRHKDHLRNGAYDKQLINKILQNNPKRYEYKILEKGDISQSFLNALEIVFIQKYNPRFNFTKGGDGTLGFNHSKETIEKILRNRPSMVGENNPMFGKHHSKEARKKMSDAKKGIPTGRSPNKGKKTPLERKIKTSRSMSTTGYFRVTRQKDNTCKQGFLWVYRYVNEKNQRKRICSVSIEKLEKKVKEKGLEWKTL